MLAESYAADLGPVRGLVEYGIGETFHYLGGEGVDVTALRVVELRLGHDEGRRGIDLY